MNSIQSAAGVQSECLMTTMMRLSFKLHVVAIGHGWPPQSVANVSILALDGLRLSLSDRAMPARLSRGFGVVRGKPATMRVAAARKRETPFFA